MKHPTRARVAIFGCGGMGRAHAEAVRAFGQWELAAVADPVAESRAQMREAAGPVAEYDDPARLLDTERPDIVVVATPATTHRDLVVSALGAGAHVLCEKPFAIALAEADEMLDAARKADRMLLVGHQFRINPRTQAALQFVRDGGIGDVLAIRCAGKGRHGGWELVETGTHLFDIALLFGGAPRWASAEILMKGGRRAASGDIVDSRTVGRLATGPVVGDRVHATIGFESGAVLQAELWDVPSNNFVNVLGTKGIVHVPLGVAKAEPFSCPKTHLNPNDAQAKWQPIPVTWGKWGEQHNLYTYDLWAQWLADPAAKPMAVNGRHPMDAENGRLAMEMIHGAFESHFQGGNRIALPLPQRDHPLARRMPGP